MTSEAGSAGAARLADEHPLDSETLDAVLDWLLAHDPPLRAVALGSNGLSVPMPASVPIAPGSVEGGGSLEFCLPEDLEQVVEAWTRARKTGGARVTVRLRADPERKVVLNFVDARRQYGVFLAFFGGIDREAAGGATPALFKPRFCIIERDELGVILSVDDAATKILGWTRDELIGESGLRLVHPDERPVAIANWMDMLARPGFRRRALGRYMRSDGSYTWFESTHENKLANPEVRSVITELVDVSERMEAVEALRANERLLRRLTEALPIGIVQIDGQRRIVHANARLGAILGITAAKTIDEQFALAAPADRAALDVALRSMLASGAAADLEVTVSGHRRCSVVLRVLTNEDGTVTGGIACVADITESVGMREELERHATFDGLTQCYNRSATLTRLAEALRGAGGPSGGVAVLYLDLDRLKEANDRLGHAAGDELLRRVAERLLNAARTGDIVGRLGGDEFLVVCRGVPTSQAALEIARRTAVSVGQPISVEGQSVVPSSSMGVAWTNVPMDAEAFVAWGDAAMYQSKRLSAGPVLFGTTTAEVGSERRQSDRTAAVDVEGLTRHER